MKTLFTLAALAAAPLAAPAMAQTSAAETLTRAVRVADLDLGKSAHVERLDERIGKAARAMCRVPSAFDLATRLRVRECVSRAMADATAQRDRAVAAASAAPETRTASR
jgi:UrcA family protein